MPWARMPFGGADHQGCQARFGVHRGQAALHGSGQGAPSRSVMTSAGVPMAGVTADDRLPGASPSRLSPVARTAIVAMLLLVGMAIWWCWTDRVAPTLAHEVRPAPVVPAPSAPALPSAVPVGLAPAPAPVAQELPPGRTRGQPPEALPACSFGGTPRFSARTPEQPWNACSLL